MKSGDTLATDGEFQPAIPKEKPQIQDLNFIRRGNYYKK